MNKIKATVVSQKHSNGLARIEALSEGYLFRLLVFEDKSVRENGANVYLLIKESEIALSKSKHSGISISNQLECSIAEIKKGEILCEIILNFGHIKLSSMITTESVERLELRAGNTVCALVKANEIYLESIDD